ncbi:MAG: hypothetical protein IH948_10765, partial [Bacteroidetes bacterium]|nr:hypothetical protein [Bacteroidota bacterium]
MTTLRIATHAGEIHIGNKSLDCAVLEDGTRVLTMTAIFKAFNRPVRSKIYKGDRVINMPSFLDAKNLQPFVSSDLKQLINPIEYVSKNKKTVKGYDSTILPMLCDVYLDARRAKKLTKKQVPLADSAEILVRTLSKIGIIALVDEATGYQEIRDRQALQAILDKYLRKELAAWAKRFPDEFYQQIFRLRGWQWTGMTVKKPSSVGNYTKDLVYERLAPGIVQELETRNPVVKGKKYRKNKHHQWLTEEVGHPALAQHLYGIIGMMRASTGWDQFYRLIQRAYPKKGETLPL